MKKNIILDWTADKITAVVGGTVRYSTALHFVALLTSSLVLIMKDSSRVALVLRYEEKR
jgi:hypothetical protein